jgi:hypothetical protein
MEGKKMKVLAIVTFIAVVILMTLMPEVRL